MNKIYNSISMILNTATLIWGRSLCRVWVSSLLTVLLKMIFHTLTGATWAIRLPWSESSFIIHSPTSFQTFMIFFFSVEQISLVCFWPHSLSLHGQKLLNHSSMEQKVPWMKYGWKLDEVWKVHPKKKICWKLTQTQMSLFHHWKRFGEI